MSRTSAHSLDYLEDGPEGASVSLLFAHGAGAGMEHPFMQRTAAGLAERGIHVVRFEFPYMHAARSTKRGRPDSPAVLMETWKHAVADFGGGQRVLVSGKSMGGRIASMIADDVNARGLVCLGYPFHPPKAPEKLRTAHLAELQTKTLIVQGTRDEFGTREEVSSYALSPNIDVMWIEDGDHSLVTRKKLGHDPKLTLERVLDAVAAFVLARSAG
jgi:predicted alpha/beta-hydrolase family hydrolase